MNAQNRCHQLIRALAIAVVLLGTMWVSATQANPLYQGADPRPSDGGSGGGSGGGAGGGSGDSGGNGNGGALDTACASLVGQVINWGFGGEGGVKNTVIGLLIFGVINNGLNQLQMDIFVRVWVRGVILLIALIINVYALRLRDVAVVAEEAE